MWWWSLAQAGWPDLSVEIPQDLAPDDAAVVISVEDYAFVHDIAGARRNGRDWYLWFTEGRGMHAAKVRLLEDAGATREEMLATVAEASQGVGPDGTLWVVFIGHGAPTPDGNDGLLLGADVQQTARSVEARGVKQAELVAAAGQRELVMVIDACFSGRDGAGEPLVPGLQPLVPTYATPTGRATVLTAARSDQYAGPLPGEERPAFSYLTLGALQGWGDADGDGVVSSTEAERYVQDALLGTVTGRTQSPTRQGPDRPMGGGDRVAPSLGRLRFGDVPVVDPVAVPRPPSAPVRAPKVVEAKRPIGPARAANLGWTTCTLVGAAATIALSDSFAAVGTGGGSLLCATGAMVSGQQVLNRARPGVQGTDPLAVGAWSGFGVTAVSGVGLMGVFFTTGGDESLITATQVLSVIGAVSTSAMTVDALFAGGERGGKVSVRAIPGGIVGRF